MQKEGDKVDNKTAYKEDRPREKRELERKIEVQILPCMHARKTTKKNLCNYIRFGGKYTLFIAKLMFSPSYAD